jgi:O-antigen/teichoic acid export membrane protein
VILAIAPFADSLFGTDGLAAPMAAAAAIPLFAAPENVSASALLLRGLRSYTLAALGVAALAVPIFLVAMPWLVRVVFGSVYLPAVAAARIVLVAAAIQLVLGWSKSLPVTVGRPHLRIVTHGIETLVLLPLVVVLGDRWGVTGAAVAFLVSTLVFAATWAVVLVRLRTELRAAGRVGAPRAAAP